MAHLVRELNVELGIWKAKLQRRKDSGKDIYREEEHISRLEARMQAERDIHAAMAAAVVLTDTWTDISWNVNNTCIYNGVSYTCKQQLDVLYTIQANDSFTGVNKIAGVTGNTLKNWNQEIFEKYKVGNGYPLPAAGETIFIVDPEATDRTPDTLNSVWWELTQ